MFGYDTCAQCHVWGKPNTEYRLKHLIPSVKRSDGGLGIWTYFAVTGPGHLAVSELNMNASVYQTILESNMRKSVTAEVWLKLGHVT